MSDAVRRVLRIVVASGALGAGLWVAIAGVAVRGLPLAVMTNGLIVLWVALIGSAIYWRLPAGYLRLRGWERDGSIYHRLGVPLFGALVRHSPLRLLTPDAYLRGRPGRIGIVRQLSAHAEAVHVWIFLLAQPLAVYAAARGWWDAAGWLVLTNGLLNVYPIMQQRLIRGRLERALARRATSPATLPTGRQP